MIRVLLSFGLLLGLAPAADAQPANPSGQAATKRSLHLRLSPKEIKTIPITRVKGAILLPARIAGQDVKVLFDNASQATLIDESVSLEAGMPVSEAGGGINTGLSVMPSKVVDAEMEIGGALTIDGMLRSADLSKISSALGTPVAAIVGADVLKPFVVVVNPAKSWIAFGLPGRITTTSKGDTGLKAPPDAEAAKAILARSAPRFVSFGPDYSVHATINREPVTLRIDYGHTGAVLLRRDVWDRAIPVERRTAETSESTRADGLKDSGPVGIGDFQLGDMSVKDMRIGSRMASRGNVEGLLGLTVLGSTVTILHMPKRQLWFFPNGQDVSVSSSEGPPPAKADG